MASQKKQYVPSISLFGGSSSETMRPYPVLFPRHVASSVLRESLLRPAFTATLGALLSLHDKQHRIGRRWSSDYFYFMNVRTLARAKDHSGMESVLLKISPFYAPDNTTIQRTQVIQLIQTIQVIQTALEIHWHHAFLMSQSLPSCQ